MSGIIVAIVAILVAALLLAIRVPIMFAIGLPALVGVAIEIGPSTLATTGLIELVGPFNRFSFAGLIVWCTIAGVLLESGLMEKYLTALHILFGRKVTKERRVAWADSVHGLALTTVSLLIVTGGFALVDDHYLLLQMLVLIVVLAVVAGLLSVTSAPRISQMTLKQMKSKDGESWKQTAKATAEVAEDGSTRRSTSRANAAVTLIVPAVLVVVSIAFVIASPVGLADLGGLVWVIVMVTAVSTRGTKWLADAGLQAILNVAYVASTAIAAWWMGDLILRSGIIPKGTVSGMSGIIWLLVGAAVLSVVVGTVLGSEAGAVFAVTLLAPFVSITIDSTVQAQVAYMIITSLLVGSAVVGGVFARFLPPRTMPWPLTVSPVHE